MPQPMRQLTSDSHNWARSLVRPLTRRYLLVLLSVAALVLVDQAILQPLLVKLNFYAPVINLAGRQRMLSQKVTKDVLALTATDDAVALRARRAELHRTLEQWATAHRALLDGDRSLGLQPVSAPIAAAMQQVEPAFIAVRTAASKLALDLPRPEEPDNAATVALILSQEPVYLRGMETVVGMLEASAKARVTWLRRCGMIVMLTVIVLLVGVNFAVLQPAAQVIRRQVEELALSDTRHRQLAEMLADARDTLELRVAQRTSELVAANASLEREMLERRTVELRMRDLSAQLAHASRVTALGELATGLAHEINQPLATVVNYAGTLELALSAADRPSAEEPLRLVSQIQQAALRAGAIVRRMRNFVRRGSVPVAQIDLNELVREVAELCGPEMRDASVQLRLDLATHPTMVAADAVQVQQVLVNLIYNALQAMAATAASERKLRIRTLARPCEMEVAVFDSGPGLPPEVLENCFQPYFSTKPDGLGMGLAISRSIIEEHHGRIWSENRALGGAVVAFSLPYQKAYDSCSEQDTHCLCS